MRNLANCTLVLATGACLALGTGISYAATVGNPSSEAVHHARRTSIAGLEPNYYALNGGGLQVTFTSSGLVGQPQLTYQDRQRTLQFSGSEIRHVDCDAGTLVSVTTFMTVDTGATAFSLLIPRVTLQNGKPAHIRTLGITTVHRLTIDTPAYGQLDTYQAYRLTGTASVVKF